MGFKGLGFRGDMHSPGVIRSLGLGGLGAHAFVYVHEDVVRLLGLHALSDFCVRPLLYPELD